MRSFLLAGFEFELTCQHNYQEKKQFADMTFAREKLEKRFREEFDKLNEQQKRAVNHLDGPVMVIAGPGTGKTQILASRIGKILLDTDTLPSNILCLTYTEAGVVAMRKRLLQFIGADAYKVRIYTFHAFCNEVIQENLSLFEKTALDPISELERTELLKQLIDSFPKNHPLKRYRGDVYYEIKNLQSLFSTMKMEGWTPAFINARIDEYIRSLPSRDEFVYKRKHKQFKAGDLKTGAIEDEKERMERLRAAVNEFDTFQQLMRKKGRYDFEDMINWVIKAFEENKNLLARYQEQFLYILVDEFQDTSGTQNRLVQLLISYWDKPNVFVVGDDDQSIYRFQGANVENMVQFANTYKAELETVILTHNYRSTQPILDASHTLISRNTDRLVNQLQGLNKDLISSHEERKSLTHLPIINEYETQRQEMIDITLHVQKLLAQGIAPGRIGILFKENKYGEELSQYFRSCKIPFYIKKEYNLLKIPLAQKIVLLLKYLAAEHDVPYGGDEMLFEILHFDWFHIPPIEIAKLSVEVADKQFSEDKTSLRRLLNERATQPPKDLFSSTIHQGLANVSLFLEALLHDVPNLTLQQLVEKLIREGGVLNQIMQSEDKHWQLQVLTGLFDFIKEETRRNPYLKLQQLVNLFELMEKEEITLPLQQVTGNDKGVNLLTIHGAKGLEFRYVFIAGCNAAYWEKKRKPGGPFKYPDNLFATSFAQEDEEELRRLFYVAVTRAEEHLYLSYHLYRNDGREMEPSRFIAEIQEQLSQPAEKCILDEEVLAQFANLQFGEAAAPEIEKLEDEFVNRILEKFVMNVTALNNFLRCPLEFYFKNLVRIPSPKNEAIEFGSAVHFALEKLFRGMQEDKQERFPPKQTFLDHFNWYMHRHRESFTKEQFERRLEYGQEVLGNYYDKYCHSFHKIVAIEKTIRNIVVGGVPLKGKLDKLEFEGKLVNVVDYKTGDPAKGIERIKGPSEKDPNGGDYWRQAVFYKLLVDHYEQRGWKAASTEFDFIEPDKKKHYKKVKLEITPADIETVTQQIINSWQKIRDHEFYIGCGKDDCHWCNFVKTNKLAVSLHELNEEEESNES